MRELHAFASASLQTRCAASASARSRSARVEHGADLPFAFEEHGSRGRPALYEYRPLVRGFVEAHARRPARARRRAAWRSRTCSASRRRDLRRAHAGPRPPKTRRSSAASLVPLLVRTAEGAAASTGTTRAFDRAYEELEESLFGSGHAYGAVAPLVGVSIGARRSSSATASACATAATGELAALWPESDGLLPRDFGRETDRLCVLELERALEPGDAEPPDAPGELADAITALRLATAAPLAAGPVLFERLDWRPYGIRPVLPIAATPPPGEPTRLDAFRGAVAARAARACSRSPTRIAKLGDALDRWELVALPGRPVPRPSSCGTRSTPLLGDGDGIWAAAMRAAALLGETPERARGACASGSASRRRDLVRRARWSRSLLHGDRARAAARARRGAARPAVAVANAYAELRASLTPSSG